MDSQERIAQDVGRIAAAVERQSLLSEALIGLLVTALKVDYQAAKKESRAGFIADLIGPLEAVLKKK